MVDISKLIDCCIWFLSRGGVVPRMLCGCRRSFD